MFGWLVLVRQNKPCGSRTLVAGNLMKTARWLPLSWERPGKEFLPSCRVHCSPWWEDLSLQKVVITLWRRLVLQIMWSYFFCWHLFPHHVLLSEELLISSLSSLLIPAQLHTDATEHTTLNKSWKSGLKIKKMSQCRKLDDIQWISLVWSICCQ